jgi:hypothetical protein
MRSVILVGLILIGPGLAAVVPRVSAQESPNSTERNRITPGEFSGKCGSAIEWRPDVAAALAEAKQSGKPVFWYVPEVEDTFMDRLPVIDQYMMAGPFSWPAVIDVINDRCIPVRAIAAGELRQTYHLEPYDFVEPGFVILSADGEKLAAVDQLTTLHPDWFRSLVCRLIGIEPPALAPRGEIDRAWEAFRAGDLDYDAAGIAADEDARAEAILLHGMFLWRRGQQEEARRIWRSAQEVQPDHPLAWKAVAEAENWGPFVRGFEVHVTLPEPALAAGVQSRGSAAPADTYTEEQLWRRSVDYLLGMQRADGAWLDSDYDFGGTDGLPNVHAAVTSLAGMALMDALPRVPERAESIRAAIDRAASYVGNPDHINYADRDEILWAHAYRTAFLARLVQEGGETMQVHATALARGVEDLESIQTPQGSWYHEYANPFVTATALTALHKAKAAGANVNSEKIALGIAALSRERFDNGAFPYSATREGRERRETPIAAAAGRMPLCEMALLLWGASDEDRLSGALAAGFDHHSDLAVAYKYDDHTSHMAYGGFFFWYDMQGRAEALSHLLPGEERQMRVNQHRELVLALPELDGCFVDSHELGRCYGTAMALRTLAILDALEKPAAPRQ